MLIVDDFLFWIFREVHKAAQQELDGEAEAITAKLSELYRMLETGRIKEAECDAREKSLLDRLDKIQERGAYLGEEEEN